MSIEIIGVLLSALCLAAMFHSRVAALTVLCVATLFQASAAITLHSLGGSPIPPGYLMIVFLGLAILIRVGGAQRLLQTLDLNRPEFLLILFVAWAIITAVFMPRLFSGMFEVFPLGADKPGKLLRQPIAPLTSNLAQSVYYVGDLAIFLMVGALILSLKSLRPIAIAVVVSVAFNILFVVIDMATYTTGTASILDFIRNAGYVQRANDVVLGMKRVTGFFSETSSFSIHAMGLFAFTFRLWRGGVSIPYTGLLSLATFIALVMSTSSTAYGALIIYLMIVLPRDFSRTDPTLPNGSGRVGRTSFLVSLIPFAGFLAAFALALRPDLLNPIEDMINEMLVNKLDSESGVERMEWNMLALQNVFDSYGLGVGLGSNRNSSFAIALISSTGIIGVFLFLLFLARVFGTNHRRIFMNRWAQEDKQIAAAARSGLIALLIAKSLSGGTSLGILFFVFAAMASYKIQDRPGAVSESHSSNGA